jgi:hypothetical protein
MSVRFVVKDAYGKRIEICNDCYLDKRKLLSKNIRTSKEV